MRFIYIRLRKLLELIVASSLRENPASSDEVFRATTSPEVAAALRVA